MTRDQHLATRELQAAEKAWLLAYGWFQNGAAWEHPKIHRTGGFVRPYSLRDAVTATRGDLTLGWP